MVIQAKKKQRKPSGGLGRGLDSLISTTHLDTPPNKNDIVHIPIANLRAGIGQPRKIFDDNALNELAESIKQNGVLQPLLVREISGNNSYEIVAGERRFRAGQVANLDSLPCIVMHIDDAQAYEIALIENIQREDLGPLEEAFGYKSMMENFQYTQEQMAKIVGKSRSRIANALRLLNLPQDVQDYISDGSLSAGHAKVLVGRKDASTLAKKIISDNMSVRETESYIQGLKDTKSPLQKTQNADNMLQQTQERLLSQLFNRSVQIKTHKSGGGVVSIVFDNPEDMNDLLNTLSQM